MKQFWQFVVDVKSVTSWVAKSAVAMPLADYFVEIGPPWPSRVAVGFVTAFIQILTLMMAFQFWPPIAKKRRELRMRVALGALVALAVAYLAMFAFLTFEHPAEGRKAKGFVLRPYEPIDGSLPLPPDAAPDAAPAAPTKATGQIEGERLLPGAGYDATLVWQPWSVYTMRFFFLLIWAGFFVALSAFIGAFVLLQTKYAP